MLKSMIYTFTETTMLPMTAVFAKTDSTHGNISNNHSSPGDGVFKVEPRDGPRQSTTGQ